MKIREFFDVEGFDPNKCEPSMFWRFYDPDNVFVALDKPCPVCPIATAADLRGYEGPKSNTSNQVLEHIGNAFKIRPGVLQEFVDDYDSYSDFERALKAAEEMEAVLGEN